MGKGEEVSGGEAVGGATHTHAHTHKHTHTGGANSGGRAAWVDGVVCGRKEELLALDFDIASAERMVIHTRVPNVLRLPLLNAWCYTHTHIPIHTHIDTDTQTQTHVCMIHTFVCMYVYTYTHTHTHTHTCMSIVCATCAQRVVNEYRCTKKRKRQQ